MRALLLWMARSTWLRERIPRLPFARRAVRRFMPGEEPEAALAQAEAFRAQGIGTLFTRLGENVVRIEEGDATAQHYLDMLEQIVVRGIPGELSVKLTQLGFDIDEPRTLAHVGHLADRAAADGRFVWVDMEGSPYTERTVASYERLKPAHANTGICLQAYLRRTAADIQRLLPLEPAIRLVKGRTTSPRPSPTAPDAKWTSTSRPWRVAMLEARAAGHAIRIGVGTHDVALIEQIAVHAAALGAPAHGL